MLTLTNYCYHRNELTYKVDDLTAQLRAAKEYVCPSVCMYLSVCLCVCLCFCLSVWLCVHTYIQSCLFVSVFCQYDMFVCVCWSVYVCVSTLYKRHCHMSINTWWWCHWWLVTREKLITLSTIQTLEIVNSQLNNKVSWSLWSA